MKELKELLAKLKIAADESISKGSSFIYSSEKFSVRWDETIRTLEKAVKKGEKPTIIEDKKEEVEE